MQGKAISITISMLAMLASPKIALADEVTVKINIALVDGVGEEVGSVKAKDTQYGLLLTPQLSGLTPGIHGFHVHENPSCDPAMKEGKSVAGLAAGGHYDPQGTGKHEGPYGNGHWGDLPPLIVDSKGNASLPVLAPRLKVSDLVGRSLIIHIHGDNYSDNPKPLGGGGDRIACGIIN